MNQPERRTPKSENPIARGPQLPADGSSKRAMFMRAFGEASTYDVPRKVRRKIARQVAKRARRNGQ